MNVIGKTSGEIFESIRAGVRSGELKPGDALPPMRDLAQTLGVNRNTVASAYKRLLDAGLAVSRGRNGTVIRAFLEQLIYEGATPGLALRDLADGNPSASLVARLLPESFTPRMKPRLYGAPAINPELEAVGRKWLDHDLNIPYMLNLTNGAVDAVERLLSSYLIAGDRVAVEDPCFLSSISTLKNNRLVADGVPMDESGMDPATLEKLLDCGVQAIIITPRAHNPTGWGLSAERALAIRQLLEKYPQVLVIVDDHFSLLSSHDYHHVIPQSTRRWALIRSTSKFLGPDLRLAFVASDRETSLRLQQRLNPGTNWVSHILQDIVTAGMTQPDMATGIEQAKAHYQEKRQQLVSALQNHGVPISDQHDGLNVWVPLAADSSEVVMQLARFGWLVRGGEIFALDKVCHGLRITVSELDEATLNGLAKALADILRVNA
jgi:DNA-binding transcriptional MocR family regulator